MKVVFRCLLSAFLAGLYSNLYAQVIPSAIRGKVLTESHLPAESSTILLLKYVDSSIVSSDIAGKEGLFKFNNVLPGDYLLLVTKIGFNKSYTGPYHVTMGQALTIDDITISSSSKQLNEVTIVSTRPEIEVSPGKITINIPNSLTAIGSSAFEILRGSPGVRVDNSNNISIIGRQSALITIDGKPTNLSGDNLVSVLRSMQSDVIERIELITAGSAKEDASAGGIINIVLKRGNNIGANATITAGAGYGRYYKDNAGIAFNDRTKKFNVFGNYNYSANKTFHDFNIEL
jgi:iron complex outermembrane receptor protein